jgi:hypothetical protein
MIELPFLDRSIRYSDETVGQPTVLIEPASGHTACSAGLPASNLHGAKAYRFPFKIKGKCLVKFNIRALIL